MLQGWTKKLEQIKSLASLPKNPATPQLEEILVPAPYMPPEKKAEKKSKGPKDGPCCKGPPEPTSEETQHVSSHKENEDEEEEEEELEEVESDSPLLTRRGKRTTSKNPKGATLKKGRVILSDS